ncbi:uridine kinase [Alphaproteobacteria bacterium]|nr:uridine kinase [Alphaproteobacteria bacterium]
MQIQINSFIQEQLKHLTNKNFSKKYINRYIVPIIKNINDSKNDKFIIAGSQGSGKSTLTRVLKLVLEKFYKKKVMLLSIDDYYLSKNKRLELSKKIHPLLITRGVPGTHNMTALRRDIINFQKKKFPIVTPLFNKLKDDISSKKKIIKKAEILLLEGWCCGSSPISREYLFKNINRLETTLDKNRVWRQYYNSQLQKDYKKVFSLFDQQIYIQAPSFTYILKWRYAQEKRNALKSKDKKFMKKTDLRKFIQHYEKLTKWMIKTMPAKADMLIKIDSNQKIKKVVI